MKPVKPIEIMACGMVTSVGLTAQSTCAAIRAGIRRIEDEVLWDYGVGEFIPTGKVPLFHWWNGVGKLVGLVVPAIRECMSADASRSISEIPLLLCLPAPNRPARWPDLEEEILAEISRQLGTPLHPFSQPIARGSVSAVAGIEMASKMMESNSIEHCILAGVDSFIDQEMINPYLRDRRIITAINSNGFSPAEAGAAVLLATPTGKSEGKLRVLGTAMAEESASISSEEPLRAEGLSNAIRDVMERSGIAVTEIGYFITDLNGEHYKFKESALSTLRIFRDNRETGIDQWHPIENFGEIGSAIGPCALGMALIANQKGYAPSPGVLFHFSNDDGERAAMVAAFENPTT